MTRPEGVRAPWWLKPANEVYKVFLRRGISFGRGHSVVLTAPVLRWFGTQVPAGVAFLKRSGLATNGTAEEVEALAGTCPVFRVDPVT
jgi:hypothetical protein